MFLLIGWSCTSERLRGAGRIPNSIFELKIGFNLLPALQNMRRTGGWSSSNYATPGCVGPKTYHCPQGLHTG